MSKNELDVLFYLYGKRCLSKKNSKRYEAIRDALGSKMDLPAVLSSLSLRQYVACKKKKSHNYWANAGRAISALTAHGYPIARGGKIPLF